MDEAGIDLRGHTSKIADRFLQGPWGYGVESTLPPEHEERLLGIAHRTSFPARLFSNSTTG